MVLLCYDASPTAKRAIPAARAVLGHKRAVVLHVWQPPSEFLAPDWFGGMSTPVGPPVAQLEALAVERAERVAQDGAELARAAGFTAESRAEPSVGRVWRTIIDVAHDTEADVIVVGARGLSTMGSVLLGSVSNAVVHHSRIPVLVIAPPDTTDQARGAS